MHWDRSSVLGGDDSTFHEHALMSFVVYYDNSRKEWGLSMAMNVYRHNE